MRGEDLDTPALLLDLDALERNLATMARFFQGVRAELRPHVKTHKTPEIARLQVAAGAIGITCAKLGEAEAMAAGGIEDILVANQVVGRQKIARLVALAQRVAMTVAVDDPENVRELSAAAAAAGVTVSVLVEVDIGMKRCGVPPGWPALDLAQQVAGAPGLRFAGLMGYEGHCVQVRDADERRDAALRAIGLLCETKRLLEGAGLPVGVMSGGGTGTYAVTGAHPEMTEIQAGSYVLMDTCYRQVTPEFEHALSLMATVISRHPDRVILDVGRKGMGDDLGAPCVRDHPEVRSLRTSEEHSTGALEGPSPLRLGDKVQVLPGHCCTTCNLHDRLYVHRGGEVEAVWEIAGRGKFA